MDNLKPCPFCGERVHLSATEHKNLFHSDKTYNSYCVSCYECNLLFGFDEDFGGTFDTEKKAIEAWNKRIK